MENPFFEQPILNSPYEYLAKHWELVEGQATQKIVENRRRADLIAEAAATAKKRGDSMSVTEKAIVSALSSQISNWFDSVELIFRRGSHPRSNYWEFPNSSISRAGYKHG